MTTETKETETPTPPDWERVKWRQLEKGERVAKGDWVDMCRDGWRDDPKWVPATKIGEAAPDPRYPSHRTFRRILGHNAEVCHPYPPSTLIRQ